MLHQLLATLRALNVRLFVEDGNLKCKAPPGVLNDELTQQIKAQKAELIAVFSSSSKQLAPVVVPGQRTDPIPLSFAQQRLWFLDQLEPNSSLYNIPVALRLTGRLDIAALRQSFNEIVRRHEVLRTVFTMDNDVPVQSILPSLTLEIENIDLTGTQADRQSVWRTLCRDEAAKPFDLTNGPLIRATLIRLADAADCQDGILMLTMHHIVSDGWSSEVLVRECSALYQAFTENKPSPLAELPIQYADFACWQRGWLAGEELERQIGYWRANLEGAPSVLELPTDHPRPTTMSYRGANYTFELPPALAEQAKALSARQNVTLFILLLAAFKVLLSRYSGQYDICVGTPVANRNRLETEGLIGFFANTLVLRSDLSANPSFAGLLAHIKNRVLDAQGYQDLPFEKLVEALQPERDTNHSPLFQVMFVMQDYGRLALSLIDLDINLVDYEGQTAKFDLTLHVQHRSDAGLHGIIEYNTDLFEQSSMARLAQHYLMLLQEAIEQPQARLSQLSILAEGEKRQVLHDWNTTDVDYPQGRCIHQLFEAQAELTPNAIALTFEQQSLSYAELNSKANQLAHYMIGQGVGPEVLVGICLERSLDMVIGLLAILKAGGAYVPMEPSLPKERIAYQLQDTGTKLLLTQAHLSSALSEIRIVCIAIDGDWTTIERQPDVNPNVKTVPSQLAYIIYTSGSTGLPKGVMISHQEVLRLFAATDQQFSINRQDVWTMFHSFAFDFSVWEIWGGAAIRGAVSNRALLYQPFARRVSPLAAVRASNDFEPDTIGLFAADAR